MTPLKVVWALFHEFIALTVIEICPLELVQNKGLNDLSVAEEPVSWLWVLGQSEDHLPKTVYKKVILKLDKQQFILKLWPEIDDIEDKGLIRTLTFWAQTRSAYLICDTNTAGQIVLNVLKLTKFLILHKRAFALLNFSAVLLRWCIQFKMPRCLRDWVFFYKV